VHLSNLARESLVVAVDAAHQHQADESLVDAVQAYNLSVFDLCGAGQVVFDTFEYENDARNISASLERREAYSMEKDDREWLRPLLEQFDMTVRPRVAWLSILVRHLIDELSVDVRVALRLVHALNEMKRNTLAWTRAQVTLWVELFVVLPGSQSRFVHIVDSLEPGSVGAELAVSVGQGSVHTWRRCAEVDVDQRAAVDTATQARARRCCRVASARARRDTSDRVRTAALRAEQSSGSVSGDRCTGYVAVVAGERSWRRRVLGGARAVAQRRSQATDRAAVHTCRRAG
jgi:hypothetical protein